MLTELDFKTDLLKKSFFGYNKEMVNTKLTQIKAEYDQAIELADKYKTELDNVNQVIQEKDDEINSLESKIDEQDEIIDNLKTNIDKLQNQLVNMSNNHPVNNVKQTVQTKIQEQKVTNIDTKVSTNIDDEDVFVGEIEDNKRTKVNESHMIGNNDNDSDDFEFL